MAETTGTEIVRQALLARQRKNNISSIAKELQIAIPALEAFAFGQAGLPVEVLKQLAVYLFPNAELDTKIDRLRSANRQPSMSLPKPLPPCDPASLPYAWSGVRPERGPQPVVPAKPAPVKQQRPGWSDLDARPGPRRDRRSGLGDAARSNLHRSAALLQAALDDSRRLPCQLSIAAATPKSAVVLCAPKGCSGALERGVLGVARPWRRERSRLCDEVDCCGQSAIFELAEGGFPHLSKLRPTRVSGP
jgi:hypothetical protein